MASNNRSSRLRKAPQQHRSRELVAKIVTATGKLLLTDGPEAITTNRIAAITGISKGSIYQYFHTKDDIIMAAIRDAAERQLPGVRSALAANALAPPHQMIDSAIDMLIAFTTDNAPTLRYLNENPEFAREVEASSNMPVLMQTMMTLHVQQYRDQYHADLEPETIAWLFINSAITTTLMFFQTDRSPIDLQQLRMGLKRMAYGLLTS
ncbi:TetR/AcrR family transcriptional regulator [Mycobacteroides salmoniphilum]|uniref:TetR/AcrR family transcriptional regulator n=1 Tax=Mycobacteroides salmoniphilum TaxID=404941 RepID=UPI0010C40302|nr:TetR/AcrR family transcriptional regulator [Mycobacteroides salmoniphilum]QCH26016.1 HTH-type transcriptional regulator BetI [Mycobacteroides salmoniphilum]